MRAAALVLAAVAIGLAAELVAGARGVTAAGDLIAGAALLACGAGAWLGRTRSAWGGLLMLAGLTWFAGTAESTLAYLHRGPLAHALLAYPDGRLGSRTALAVTIAAYVEGLLPGVAGSEAGTLAYAGALVGAAAVRHGTAHGPQRGARLAALIGAAAVALALSVAAITRLLDAGLDRLALLTYDAAVALVAVGLLLDLRRARWGGAAVTGLVVDLGELKGVRDSLGKALGDPGVTVAFASDDGGWVNEAGAPVDAPSESADRAIAWVEDERGRAAAIAYDAGLARDPELVRAVAATVRLAIGNARLQAELQARVRELTASRRRLVDAGDRQRSRFEAALREGVERRLGVAADRLGGIENGTGESNDELVAALSRARADLREFATGVRRAGAGGLAEALQDIAAALPFKVDVDVSAVPLPEAAETTVWFLCSEALANVGKHAHASRAEVVVRVRGDRLEVVVRDDGVGGAALAAGTGLRGLADRIEALSGGFAVESPRGGGTEVRAWLPLGD